MPEEFNTEKEPPFVDDAPRDDPVVIPYVNFPSFEAWVSQAPDLSTFDKFASQLEVTRDDSTPEALEDAVRTATRWAAINTGAIEGLYEADRGFTYTVAVSAAAWNDIHKLKGSSAAASMQDAIDAYEFVLDAVTRSQPISEAWIRKLHETVTASQETYSAITPLGVQEQPLPKGVYKTQPNSPLNIATNIVHSYAPPIDTPSEMARFVDELRSRAFIDAHPVAQAAYAHYAFVCVHPFADGNGRVSRALASIFTYRNPGVPLVIFADQKSAYIDALEAADDGKFGAFIRFISERVIDTVQMVRSEISKALVPNVADQMAQLASVLSGKQGISHTEIDAIAARSLEVFQAALQSQVESAGIAPPIGAIVQQVQGSVAGAPPGYRSLPDLPNARALSVGLTVQSRSPAKGEERRQYAVAVARPGTDGPDFIVHSAARHIVEFDLREIHETVSPALVYRFESEAQREIREAVAIVAAKATASLRRAGYV